MDTLANMERVDTDNKDRPIEDLIIQRAVVFVDPFVEADEQVGKWGSMILGKRFMMHLVLWFLLQLAKERQEELEKAKEKEANLAAKKETKPERKIYSKGVGKFINPSLKKEARWELLFCWDVLEQF